MNSLESSLVFHVLSFEGPDVYAHSGGLATRVTGLCDTLSELGHDTHLWFIGDPELPGNERRGQLHLHRWAQWLSRNYPGGVYDGEEPKLAEYTRSLPPRLVASLMPHLRRGGRAVVMAEEWHTAAAVLALDELLRAAGVRDRVALLWNANNTFGFDRIDWPALSRAAVITTVSRYMKHLMAALDPRAAVVPNGVSDEAFGEVPEDAAIELRRRAGDRTLLAKIARWDPDKRWLLAIDIVGELKRAGFRPLLIARGGKEPHGREVLARAAAAGLRVVDRELDAPGAPGLIAALVGADDADVINLQTHMDWESRRLLYGESDAVLANSGHEPFGLVGLETMAVGGVACTGCSGEDYAVPGHNALVTQTDDPNEFVELFHQLRSSPDEEQALRCAGRDTARRFTWPSVIRRALLPRVQIALRAAIA